MPFLIFSRTSFLFASSAQLSPETMLIKLSRAIRMRLDSDYCSSISKEGSMADSNFSELQQKSCDSESIHLLALSFHEVLHYFLRADKGSLILNETKLRRANAGPRLDMDDWKELIAAIEALKRYVSNLKSAKRLHTDKYILRQLSVC